MPLRLAGGWRKRWRYASAFGEELMLCAASVEIGIFGQSFWAILDRSTGESTSGPGSGCRGRGEVWSVR